MIILYIVTGYKITFNNNSNNNEDDDDDDDEDSNNKAKKKIKRKEREAKKKKKESQVIHPKVEEDFSRYTHLPVFPTIREHVFAYVCVCYSCVCITRRRF